MGSSMWRQHLKEVVRHLVTFENKPKEIEGRVITEWFRSGENIFVELYLLGDSIEWNSSAIRGQPEVSEIITCVTKNQHWLQTFINIYPTLRIDLEVGFARNVCKTRSGLELLLRGFSGIDARFNKVLVDLEERGELDELDRCLKLWRDSGYPAEPSVPGPLSAPRSHWWWH